jgi:hypothetical protein
MRIAKAAFEKNYRDCIAGLVTKLKRLTQPPTQTP